MDERWPGAIRATVFVSACLVADGRCDPDMPLKERSPPPVSERIWTSIFPRTHPERAITRGQLAAIPQPVHVIWNRANSN